MTTAHQPQGQKESAARYAKTRIGRSRADDTDTPKLGRASTHRENENDLDGGVVKREWNWVP